MKSLFINTSTRKATIGIVEDDKVLYYHNEFNDKDLSTNLMVYVDEAFKTASLKPKDIDTIFVTTGPGSFTGIRLGVTVAKVMAWGLKIKVIPISSLELMAATKTDKKYIAPLIDARRGYVFAGLYDNELNVINKDAYILLDEFKKKIEDKDVLFVSDEEFEFDTNNSDYDILKVINKHKDDEGVNPHKLNPNYLKNTEAEEKFNGGEQ